MKTFTARPCALAAALAAASLLTLVPIAAAQNAPSLPSLPKGLQVISGQAQLASHGNAMIVTNSAGAILNWASFNIGASSGVRFDQPSAASQVLNRVVGNDPSVILGRLSSNGRVWLLNPNGVLFGENARIDVGGLVASTLRLNDDDWRAGRWSFSAAGERGAAVSNRGELRSTLGGSIALIGSSVANEGLIEAPGGQVLLAAGAQVDLVDTGVPHLSVRVRANAGEATNLGRVIAPGGRVDLHAAAVNQNGIVRADSLAQGPAGTVLLRAASGVQLGPDSVTSADGTRGGTVTIDAGEGRTSLHGSVSARGLDGSGGSVQLLGREVGLFAAAGADVSGARGGGELIVGGGLQGRDARFPNAQAVFVAPTTSLRADALDEGSGGSIVLWSDRATRAFGNFSARGGPLGGDGGFIETSGGWLDARPARIDLSASRGAAGRWLLDPYNIVISDSAGTANVDASFTATGSPATISTATLSSAISAGTHVTVSTGGAAGAELGEIMLSGVTLSIASPSPGSLTLIADGPIVGSAVSIASSASMPLTLLAGRAGSGGISLSAASIATGGGNIMFGGFASAASAKPDTTITGASQGSSFAPDGVHLSGVTLNAGSGDITLKGIGFSPIGSGVVINGGSVLSARNISLQGNSVITGVEVNDGTLTASTSISVLGNGGNRGVRVQAPSSLSVSGPGLLETWGKVLSGDTAVLLDAAGGSSPLLRTTGGASIIVRADNCGGCDDPALRLFGGGPALADTSIGGGPISFEVYGKGNAISSAGAVILGGSGAVSFDAGSSLSLAGTSISAGGPVRLYGDSVGLSGVTGVASAAAGDAIVVAGGFSPHMLSFSNSAGSGVLSTPAGRWIVFADNVLSEGFSPGSLAHDFKRHGSFFGGWAGDSGNGFVFAAPQTAVVTGSVSSKVYDGTTAAVSSGLTATGIEGESSGLRPGVSLIFADKHVGTSKALEFSASEPFSLIDSSDRPVFGYTFSTAGLKADITPRPASVSGLSVLPKVYDATTVATLGGTPSFTGVLPGDVVTLDGGSGATFADKNVGSGKPVSLAGLALGGPDGGNYAFAPIGALTGTITLRPVTITGLAAANKVYDGTTAATLSGTPTVAPLPGDSVSATGGVSGSFSDKRVGTAKPVTLSGTILAGPDAGNYTLEGAGALSADITPRPLVVSGLAAANKVYDATTVATLSGSGSVTPLPGDSVTLSTASAGAFADKNVGTGKPVSLSGAVLAGPDAANYSAVAAEALTADITPRALFATGLVANDKVYDGTTTASFSGSATVTPLAGDLLAIGGTPLGSFADRNAGRDKPVTVSGLSLAGADVANYTLQPITDLVADITAAFVPVSGLTALPKVYDASTSATLSGAPVIVAGGGLTLTGTATGRFADKNAGVNKPVGVTGLGLIGPEAANFQLQFADLRADITPLTLSVAGISAANKVYDSTSNATLTGLAGVAGLPGDTVSLSGSLAGRFADKNVGTNKAVTVSGLELIGADAANYRLSTLASLAADITPRPIVVSGLGARDKVYDGNAAAQLSGSAAIAPLAGDALVLGGSAVATFADKNAGAIKPVTVSGLSLAGADAANYALQPVSGLSAGITPLTVPVTGLSSTPKVYDGTANAPLAGSAAIAALAADAVSLAGSAAGSFADKNAGTAKPITIGGLNLAGADAPNYRIALPALRGDVTPATLLYVATPIERLFGQPIGAVSGSLSGFAPGDNAGNATSGTLGFATPAVTGSVVGSYPITGSGLSAPNYRLAQAPGNPTALSVVRLPPQVAADSGANLGVDAAVQMVLPPAPLPSPTTTGVADLSVPLPPLTTGTAPPTALGASPITAPSAGTGTSPATTSGTPAGATVSASGAAFARTGAAFASTGAAGSSLASAFEPVRVASLSSAEMQEVLGARERYKQAIFADAIAKLEQNPALADLQVCASLQDAQAGTCLVTEELKQQHAAQVRVTTAAPLPPAPAPTPAPAAPPAAPPAVAAAAPAALPGALPEVLERRRVVSAALPQIERKVALLVGVNEYRDSTIPALANAVKDARTVGRLFATELGYETFVLPDASRSAFVAALNRLALELQPRDSVVVYYAGHGQLVESTQLGYWQLADADAKNPQTWLSNADISRLVGRIGASQVAVISDSCYSGSLVAEQRLRAGGAPVDPVAVLTRKSVVVMSSGGNEPVFDDGKQGHSPFAWSLMNTLRQVQTWQAGGQVFERVRFAVARELPQRPQYGVSSAAGHQPGGDYLFETRELELPR